MSSGIQRREESVILVELLFLLLSISLLRLVFSPDSGSLSSVFVLWVLLAGASYVVGEFETAVRLNFGLSLQTQAAFALSYVAYSGIHVVWPWCEALTVRFWLGLWLYLNIVAPVIGILVRRLVRHSALLVSDRHRDATGLLRWWGFECAEIIGTAGLAEWLKGHTDRDGRVLGVDIIVVDVTDYRNQLAVEALAGDCFADFVGVPSVTMFGYLVGPHPRYISAYALGTVVRRLKRVLDLAIAGFAILLLGLPLLAVALAIKLDSRGPVFYGHKRLGRNMKPFKLYKFRTMYKDADARLKKILESDPKLAAEFAATFKLKNDPRVTRVGRFLRKFSIDELPQFFNIIAGQMSVVGPRPIVEKEVDYYRSHSLLLFRVPPGATGLWQVSGRTDTSYQQRVEMDTRYVEDWTLWWDLGIILKTPFAVLSRKGAY